MGIHIHHDYEYGFSSPICDYILRHQIEEIKPKTMVDFGAGAGKVGKMVEDVLGDECKSIAVEGSSITAQMLEKQGPYQEVCNELLETWISRNSARYDLAVFGDVIEHLDPKQIHFLIRKSLKIFDHIIIQVPLHELFQEGPEWNPLETHRSYITMNFFDRYGPTEKHVVAEMNRALVKGRRWLIMNVHLSSQLEKVPFYRLAAYWIYHASMVILQPFGLARPFANILRKVRDCVFTPAK